MNRFGHFIFSTVFGLFAIALEAGFARAQELDTDETIPNRYAKDYVFLSALPLEVQYGQTRETLDMKAVGFGVKYAHRLQSDWVVGLGIKRKPMIVKVDDRPISLLSFSSQTQKIVRLYHPLYLLVGTEVSFVIPAQKSSPPFAKDPAFATEVAAGLNASLWWLSSRKGAIELHLSRWKGTKTNKLQGLEVSLGYGVGF
jgi:hypothetical protein